MTVDVLEQIDDLFTTDQTVADDTGSLDLIAGLLTGLGPRILLVANQRGRLFAAREEETTGPGEARKLGLELAEWLAGESWVIFEKTSTRCSGFAFGLRLFDQAEGGFFGGVVERREAKGTRLEDLRPVLAVHGLLSRQTIRTHTKNMELETKVRNLTAEHNTIRESLEQSIANAIEEHEKRIRDQQNHVLHLEEEVDRRSRDLREAMERAEEANKLKTEFLANMSHELRTPLHGILSFASFGFKKYASAKPEKVREYFEKIQKSGKTLLALLNNLLDLAKMEAGKMTYEFASGHLGVALLQVTDEFMTMTSERKVKIVCDFKDQNEKTTFDGEKIKQVARNLLSNAIKFSPEDGTIRLGMEKKDGRVTVWVRDEGPGIPVGEMEKVFDKFVQSSKTKSGAGGTGLGLAICREIIAAHQGRIWAQNNPEGGARFSFELPLSIGQDNDPNIRSKDLKND
jgi:signal transduction histidine kinase